MFWEERANEYLDEIDRLREELVITNANRDLVVRALDACRAHRDRAEAAIARVRELCAGPGPMWAVDVLRALDGAE